MKNRRLKGFGSRLAELRKSRGLTQIELASRIGVSPRIIGYYEEDEAQPPGILLIDLARVLRVSADELLGIKPVKDKLDPTAGRLLRRLKKIEALPLADQRAIFKFIDALLKSRITIAPTPQRVTNRRPPFRKVAGKR